jgi:GR25 family glycosyltransferase involved in LPS biosynthesis
MGRCSSAHTLIQESGLASPCYVINLDSREDRRFEFYSQVKKAGIEVERISAITSDPTWTVHSTPPGVTACWLSHQKALLKFLETDAPYAFIFEDDAVFTAESFEFISNFNSYFKPDFDLLQIGYLKRRGRLDSGDFDLLTRLKARKNLLLQYFRGTHSKQPSIVGRQLLVANSFEAGTHAYVCSREMAKLLVTFNNPVILAADLALIQIARSKLRNCYRLARSLVSQSDSASSIMLRQIS